MMLLEERRQKLADFVSQRGFVTLPDLVAHMGVSESTVRRDLDHLHEIGLVRRTHGGAIAAGGAGALPPLEERAERQADEKSAIAQVAAQLIRDGETILLDGGTTTLEIARRLIGRSLQVVTNSLPIANLVSTSREIDLVLLGGYVYPKTGVALGSIAQDAIQKLHVDRLFMGVSGLTERGVFNGNLLLVETERAMMRSAKETIVVADHTKFGRAAFAFLDDWTGIRRAVTDSRCSQAQRNMIPASVEVLVGEC